MSCSGRIALANPNPDLDGMRYLHVKLIVVPLKNKRRVDMLANKIK
jgi:hypothetical protein